MTDHRCVEHCPSLVLNARPRKDLAESFLPVIGRTGGSHSQPEIMNKDMKEMR